MLICELNIIKSWSSEARIYWSWHTQRRTNNYRRSRRDWLILLNISTISREMWRSSTTEICCMLCIRTILKLWSWERHMLLLIWLITIRKMLCCFWQQRGCFWYILGMGNLLLLLRRTVRRCLWWIGSMGHRRLRIFGLRRVADFICINFRRIKNFLRRWSIVQGNIIAFCMSQQANY